MPKLSAKDVVNLGNFFLENVKKMCIRMLLNFRRYFFSRSQLFNTQHSYEHDNLKLSLPSTAPKEFSIISFNTLTRWYYHWGWHVRECHKDWRFRKRMLHDMLSSFNADVICLQEINAPTFEEDFGHFIRQIGYGVVVQKRKGKDGRFTMVNATCFRLSKFSVEWENHRSRALILGLREKESEEFIVIINVHLKGGPNEEDTRLSQLKSSLCKISKFLGSNGKSVHTTPVVISGDFNCSSESASHQFLKKSGEYSRGHDFSSFDHCFSEGNSPISFCAKGSACCIDFIYVIKSILEVGYVLDNLPERRKSVALKTQLPNHFNPSDHLPVGCILKLVELEW